MDWVGIGVTLLGVAFFVLVVLLIKPLRTLSGTLDNLKETTSTLPEQVNSVTEKATETIQQGNETLHEVNRQMNEINPFFAIIGNIGRTLHAFSSYILDVVSKVNTSTTPLINRLLKREHMEALLSFITVGYVLSQRQNQKK
jgi:uncharacterized protein YoxC